jgi:hypothetical protein
VYQKNCVFKEPHTETCNNNLQYSMICKVLWLLHEHTFGTLENKHSILSSFGFYYSLNNVSTHYLYFYLKNLQCIFHKIKRIFAHPKCISLTKKRGDE